MFLGEFFGSFERFCWVVCGEWDEDFGEDLELPLKRFFGVLLIVGIFGNFANFRFAKLAENY